MRSRYPVALSHGSSLPQQRGQTAPLKVTKVTVTPRSSGIMYQLQERKGRIERDYAG